jgi:hypothetical protein
VTRLPKGSRKSRACASSRAVFPIDNGEVETEFLCEFVLPLQQHRSGRRDNYHLDTAPQQQFSHDQAGFYRLAETNIIRDQ